MPFALEINTNGGLKQEYAESCPSTSNYSQIWQDGDLPYEGFPPINSYDPLITWSCEVT